MKPKEKYNFYTGKEIKRVKKFIYKYLGKGKPGLIERIMVDKKKVYFLVELSGFGRISPYTFDKSQFKKIEKHWIEDINWNHNQQWVLKEKPKDKIEVITKIKKPKGKMTFRDTEIKITKTDNLLFFETNKSIIIRELQLKEGDKLKFIIKKIKWHYIQ